MGIVHLENSNEQADSTKSDVCVLKRRQILVCNTEKSCYSTLPNEPVSNDHYFRVAVPGRRCACLHTANFLFGSIFYYIYLFFSWYIWPVQGTKDYKILVCNVVHYWNVHSDIYSHFWSFKWIGYPLIHEEYNLEMHTWVFPLSVEKQPNIGNNIITLKHIFVDIWLIKRRSIQK